MVNSPRAAAFGFATAAFIGAAWADPSGFVGTWSNSAEGPGFFSRLVGGGGDDAAVSRVVVTPAGAASVRIHLYGRCTPECDWGSQLGHVRSEAPDSSETLSISAEFNTGKAIKRLTLRRGAGNALRFELTTDFTDHAGHNDYEIAGSLQPVPVPVAAAAPAAGPALTTGLAPAAATALAAADVAEDCEKINPEDIYVAPADGSWKVNDFNHTIVNFGSDKVGAVRASRVLEFYRFDEQCYVARPKAQMIYWRVAGQFPRDAMPGEDCVALDLAALALRDGKVLDGDRLVIDFDGDAARAAQAVSVLRSYHVNRQCFVARPSGKMVYWLSR